MRLAGFAAAALLVAAPADGAAPPGAVVSQVAFANSGAPAAQAPFLSGLGLLHNFEYSAAAAAFREAQKADPGFALAYWGEAMTYNHPVWLEQDAVAARAVLARLGGSREIRLAKAKTERERAWLDSVETLYGEGSKEERDRLYSAKMGALFAARPDDVDARAFYALSLLGLAHQGRDVPLYMRAAALLEEVFPDNRSHPGVLHYLIHSYDDPAHAPLGLRAARLYDKVAPEAGHALHMTSHIFVALGQWQEVERANVEAMAVVNRQRAAAGRPAGHCGHYAEWLAYARLQRLDPEAETQIRRCRDEAAAELESAPSTTPIEAYRSSALSWAGLALRQLIDTGRWDGPGALALPEGRYLMTRVGLAYGEVLAAAGDPAKARSAHARLRAAVEALSRAQGSSHAEDPQAPRRSAIILFQASGLEKLAAGDNEGGIADLRAAAAEEAAMPAEFGPPAIPKPSYELLGDALLALGRKAEAAQAYRSALAAAPGRRLSERGLAASR
jgi:tetratricopeptide (TPR) repeat protein